MDGVEEVVSSLSEDGGVKGKYVVHVSLPEIYGEGAWRREQMAELGEYRLLCSPERVMHALQKLISCFSFLNFWTESE